MFAIWIPQIAAFLAAFLVTWGAKRGLTFDHDVLAATFVGIFAIVKTVVGKYTNPGNVNAPELVEESKVRATQARAARAARRAGGR